MSGRQFLHLFFIFVSLTILTSLVSCEKFSGGQTIPAYVTIDSIYLETNYGEEGSASHSITDAWIYVDDELIGAFQLPARFPVLENGEHKLKILPGVKRNGIAATRTNYPFYRPIEQTVRFKEDSTIALGVIGTTYESGTEFYILEDFEGLGMILDTTPRSDVPINLTLSGDTLTFQGNHSGLIEMATDGDYFECVNNKDYVIPYAPVFLEIDFNTNNTLGIGVFVYGTTYISQIPVLYLNPTEGQWKKVYVDLTTALNSVTGAQKFRIFLGTSLESDVSNAKIAIDNIKVISRDITK